MIFFCLSQIRVGWKQTIVVVRSLWAQQPLTQEGFLGGAVRPFGLTFPSWCVGGYFNVIRRRSEKLGGSGFTSNMRDFDGFIRECELHDPPLQNASFTWSNM